MSHVSYDPVVICETTTCYDYWAASLIGAVFPGHFMITLVVVFQFNQCIDFKLKFLFSVSVSFLNNKQKIIEKICITYMLIVRGIE